MIHIKYRLDRSQNHGVGLFADQDIQKGDVVYTPSPLLDVNLAQEQFNTLDEKEKREIQYWGFFDEPSQKWHVDFDVSRFINHSYDATLTQDHNYSEAHLIATRDLKTGDELTQNYLEFETKEDLSRRGILSRE